MYNNMSAVIFREYDIRGKVDQELYLDEVYNVGLAIAYFFVAHKPDTKTVALGMDGRIHSERMKNDLARALQDSGLDVVFIGLCHSPALYFAMHTMSFDAGLMVTASHNPKEYNGIKISLGKETVWGVSIQEIYSYYQQRKHIKSDTQGSYSKQEVIPAYVDWLVDHCVHLKKMSLRVIVDCGNGAGGAVLPLLVEKMEWSFVTLLYAEVDGTYPHHEADPVNIENMRDVQQYLKKGSFDLAIGLDGDVDRMAPMTKTGRLVPGDLLLGIFAHSIIAEHKHVPVVFDIKSSMLLIEYLEQMGAVAIISPSGHSIIRQEMKKNNALLGGELSCHFFFKDRYFGYDDGIYAMLRLFEILINTGKNLDQLLAVYPQVFSSPEYRIPCAEDKKHLIVQTATDILAQKKNVSLITIDGVRVTMPCGWGLLRSSNTQPMVSLRFESQTAQGLVDVKKEFIHILSLFYPVDVLEKLLFKDNS